jgi:uncharacterized protein (TIGR02594 family)
MLLFAFSTERNSVELPQGEAGMADPDKLQPDDPPWLQIAFRHLGDREIPGRLVDNPVILNFAASTPGAVDEEIPWCSSFVNFCFEESGIKGTDNRAARSWLNFGTPTNTPVRGCVVVFKRGAEGSGLGHVGFYLSGSTQTGIRVIGGNQSDMVSIVTQDLPFLGYRLGPDQGGLDGRRPDRPQCDQQSGPGRRAGGPLPPIALSA